MPTVSATLPDDRGACTPCRGTGKVISGLGGTPHEQPCPWCGGSGRWSPPQGAVREDRAESPAAAV